MRNEHESHLLVHLVGSSVYADNKVPTGGEGMRAVRYAFHGEYSSEA